MATNYVGLHDPRLGGADYEREMAELRRQQAAFAEVRRDLDRRNNWMAVPVLASVLAPFGAEAVIAAAARPILKRGPHSLWGPKAFNRAGETVNTIEGKARHAEMALKMDKKAWITNPSIRDAAGRLHRPDALTPGRKFFVELKPDTASGRAAGARQLERYKKATEGHGRIIFYKPKY